MSYKHLSITEREKLLIHLTQGLSLCQIAKLLGRNKSTISRELARNPDEYLPSKAQMRYIRRRKKCRPHKLFENPELFALVRKLFLVCHWSPEQIANRLKLEDYSIQISYKTIYRAIYAAMFDTQETFNGQSRRNTQTAASWQAAPSATFPIEEKSPSVMNLQLVQLKRTNAVDSAIGKRIPLSAYNRKSGLLTLVDRKSRFLKCEKLTRLGSKEVEMAMIAALRGQPVQSITPDRGREFQLHGKVTAALGVEFYFPPTRIPTACCANIFLKAMTSVSSAMKIYKQWLTNLITVRENVWVIEHLRKFTFPLCCT